MFGIFTWYDILSFILISCNVIGTFIICYMCSKIPFIIMDYKTKLLIRLIMNGIALIEVLFFISLHAWVVEDMGASIGYLKSFSSKIYTIAENVKSLYFLAIIIFIYFWIKKKLHIEKVILENDR